MQPSKPTDRPYILLGEITHDASSQGLPNNGTTSDSQHVTQELTTAYITTLYYSALSNLYIQSTLPDDISAVDAEMPRLKIAFERSYADFIIAAKWLAENGGEFIGTSTAKKYYDEVLGMEDNPIKDISTFYSQRAR
jgi:hypothetical protein